MHYWASNFPSFSWNQWVVTLQTATGLLLALCMPLTCYLISMCPVAIFLGSRGQISTHLDKEIIADQSKDSYEVQLGKPLGCIGATSRSMNEGLLTGPGMTQRQLCHRQTP